MPDIITSNFDLQAPFPIETSMQAQSINDRNSINEFKRWDGMQCYVIDEQKTYRLTGGIANSQWQEMTAGAPTPGNFIPMSWVQPSSDLNFDSDQRIPTSLAVADYVSDAIGDIDVLGTQLTGYTVGPNTALAATDTILAAFGKAQGQINARVPTSRTLDMNPGNGITVSPSTAQNLTANRTWNFSINETYLNTLYIPLSQKAAINGVASLDANGHVPSSQLPPLVLSEVFVENSEAAMLGLTAQIGDVCVRTDINTSFILQAEPASTLSNWVELLNPGAPVQSVNGQTGSVQLDLSFTGGQLSLTGDGSVDLNAWGDNRYYPLSSNPAGYITSAGIPPAQTLTMDNNTGQLSISAGNTQNINTLFANVNLDGGRELANAGNSWFRPFQWGAAQSGWDHPSGSGFEIIRRSTDTDHSGFQIFKRANSASETGIKYKEKLTGDMTSWSPERTFASQEWSIGQFVTLGAIGGNIDASTADPNTITGSTLSYISVVGGSNTPSWATTDGLVLTGRRSGGPVDRQLWIGRLGEVGVRGGVGGGGYTDDWIQLATVNDIPAPQDLQAVTDIGATTSNAIAITGNTGTPPPDGFYVSYNASSVSHIEHRIGGSPAGSVGFSVNNDAFIQSAGASPSILILHPESAAEAGAEFNSSVSGNAARNSIEFLNGNNAGFGMNWNNTNNVFDWGVYTDLGAGASQYSVEVPANTVLGIGDPTDTAHPVNILAYNDLQGITASAMVINGNLSTGSGFVVLNTGTDTRWAVSAVNTGGNKGLDSDSSQTSGNGILVIDSQTLSGLIYEANYSAANASNPRWITDKAYVDSVSPITQTISGEIPALGAGTAAPLSNGPFTVTGAAVGDGAIAVTTSVAGVHTFKAIVSAADQVTVQAINFTTSAQTAVTRDMMIIVFQQ